MAMTERHPQLSLAELGYEWFQRILGAGCLLFGLLYWIRLVGYYQGELWRFDLMPPHWQVAAVVLAVLYPLAASGLWMLASWGPVIWLICAAAETIMFAGFPQLFGQRFAIVVVHGVAAILFVALRGTILLEERRRRGKD